MRNVIQIILSECYEAEGNSIELENEINLSTVCFARRQSLAFATRDYN